MIRGMTSIFTASVPIHLLLLHFFDSVFPSPIEPLPSALACCLQAIQRKEQL